MTSRRAQRRRRDRSQPRRHARGAEHDVGVQVGWCATEALLPETRQRTHDQLIKQMGSMRTGGVEWRQLTGDPAFKAIDLLANDTKDPAAAMVYRQVRGHLREYGGWLVIASAPGRQGRQP